MHTKSLFFESQGVRCAAHLYLPTDPSPARNGLFPAILLCHGFCGVKEMLLPAFARRFSAQGFACMTFDYRGFGESEGERGRLLPELQLEDISAALDCLRSQAEVDASRVALWGTSFGGANAIVAGSRDNQVKAVVAQITFGCGERAVTASMPNDEKERFVDSLRRFEEKKQASGKEMFVPLPKVLTDPQSRAFVDKYSPIFPEAMSVRIPFLTPLGTMRHCPEKVVGRLGAPLLLVGAEEDQVNNPEEMRHLFDQACEPKELWMVPGAGHYDLYEEPLIGQVAERQGAFLRQFV